MLVDILQFLYHLWRRHVVCFRHFQSRKEDKSTRNHKCANHWDAFTLAELLDEGRDDEWSRTGCSGYLWTDWSDLSWENLALNDTKKAIPNACQESEERHAYHLHNRLKSAAILNLLIARGKHNHNKRNEKSQSCHNQHHLPSFVMIHHVNAEGWWNDLGGADYYCAPIDVRSIILYTEFWNVELEADKEMKKDTEDGNRAQWVIPEEI